MPRSKARRRRTPRVRTYGKEFGQGPRAQDGVSGFEYPVKDMVKQRGVLVHKDYLKEKSRDRPDTW